jgi:GntR family transcriptional regulator / MocR family aminotransferase
MVVSLDGRGPRYAQIIRALIALVERGVLSAGSRAPATRELARDLGCSRNVVLMAYEQLIVEGYFVSREREGTFVARELSPRSPPAGAGGAAAGPSRKAVLSPHGRGVLRAARAAMGIVGCQPGCAVDFVHGLSVPDDRLLRALRRALSKPLRDRAFSYGSAAGDPALREQISLRLRAARGIARPIAQIVLTSGTQQALDICARLLLGQGDRVVVEDPGYEAATAAFRAAGATVLPVPVDRDGLDPARLPAGRRSAKLVYVTPSHQFPTGAVLPAARRYALLAWARRARAYVFEDDYDGEFRFAGQPIPALAGLDPDVVIYCGTFAKSLFPSCRLGYLVLPPALVEPAVRCKWLTDRGSFRLVEGALAELFATGHYDRHVRRMLRRYRARRDTLVRSLRRHLGAEVEIEGSSAGLHLVAWLPALPPARVRDLVAACRERGIGVYPLAAHAARPPKRAALVLGYGVVDVNDIEPGVSKLAAAYRQVRPVGELAALNAQIPAYQE